MHYSVYAGFVFASLFGVVAPTIVRRLPPDLGTWLLSVGSAIAAVSGVAALGLLAMTLIGQDSAVAAEGHWSIPALRHADPVELPVAVAALAGLITSGVRVTWVARSRWQTAATARRINHAVADTGSDLIVLEDLAPDAYAVPGRPGRVFVTHGMLTLLSRDECDVMLAHERSHLRHRHHWHRTVVLLAGGLNPLLLSLPPTQEWLTERWADEDAARSSERAVVAAALARAAAASPPAVRYDARLALTSQTVDSRIAALQADAPRRRPLVVAVALGILLLSVAGTLDGMNDEAQLFRAATVSNSAALTHAHPIGAHTVSS